MTRRPPFAVFDQAAAIRARFVSDSGYGIVYGSHAQGTASPNSDLDLMLVSATPLSEEELAALVEQAKALHHQHGLRLDQEVPYENKLHVTSADVAAAYTMEFPVDDSTGRPAVPPVTAASPLLRTPEFTLRLILNALTTEHVFLGGSEVLYQRHVERAECTLINLARGLNHRPENSIDALIAAVLQSPDGIHAGEDYLGYYPTTHLYSTMQRALARIRNAP